MTAFIQEFRRQLALQRWDDHRYYHQSRINQTLHLISALSFLVAYGLLFIDPAAAALVGWLVSMTTRQAGHFFFEPLGFDHVNQATHDHKEAIKVGYNLRRKVILLSVWVAIPAVLCFSPDFFGLLSARQVEQGMLHTTAILWLATGIGAVIVRTVHLFFLMGIQSGLVWACKILTDPFHDIRIYYKAPWYILKGEMYDDMSDWYAPMPGHGA